MLIELLFLDTKIYLIVVDILDKDTNNYRETEQKRHINFQKKMFQIIQDDRHSILSILNDSFLCDWRREGAHG